MIFVLFPPGCYGSYIGRSLYYYTDLNPRLPSEFVFNQHGSSHLIRQNVDLLTKIRVGHCLPNVYSQVVTLLPFQDHYLDYFNNQFAKNTNFNLTEYIRSLIDPTDFAIKLSNWGPKYTTIETAPRWVLREFFSFWLIDCFANRYNIDSYLVDQSVSISTVDIFQNFYYTIAKVSCALGLTLTASKPQIENNHAAFLKSQLFHKSQIKCADWVSAIINTNSTSCPTPCQTIFDEAYVQHLLRESGYQIKCDGLNIFPATSAEMQLLIYKQ
jgi:hypothetical protein